MTRILFGVAPLASTLRTAVNSALKEAGRSKHPRTKHAAARAGGIRSSAGGDCAQRAGLVISSMVRLLGIDSGFNSNVLTMQCRSRRSMSGRRVCRDTARTPRNTWAPFRARLPCMPPRTFRFEIALEQVSTVLNLSRFHPSPCLSGKRADRARRHTSACRARLS